MTKEEAIKMIDKFNKKLVNPKDMLHLVWLRVIINQIPPKEWDSYVLKAAEVLNK